jgi:hypothetical protein
MVVSVVLILICVAAFHIVQHFTSPSLPADEFVPIGSMQVGAHSVQFHVHYGYDSAVLGFSVDSHAGRPRYFPMYCSTYRGMPPVTLDVFLSDTQEEMWVLSSWSGYETLAYYRVGSDRCTTGYGENSYFDTPTLQSIGGSSKRFPEMEPARVKKIATITYAK